MFDNPEAVSAVYFVAGLLFLVPLFVGAVSTIARVIYYRFQGIKRPRLLTRDAITYGGLALTFAEITVVRFLPAEVRTNLTSGNVLWALATTVPAVIAVACYAWYELVVIERIKGEEDVR